MSDREVLLMQANAALMRYDNLPPVREQLADALAFLLMAIAAWWDKDTWRMRQYDAERFGWHKGFGYVYINPRDLGDGWRPGRYV